ncbi:MAG: PaaI family thioesterase [Myxococcota bacterium]|nr:PaaI family thioesterase [Myxococcota bacterium]
MDFTALVQTLLSAPPDQKATLINRFNSGFDSLIGLQFLWVDALRVEACCNVSDAHLQAYGLVHGGVYASMGESVCSVGAAISVMSENSTAVGIENQTQFLKAMRVGGRITATAQPISKHRNRRRWKAELIDETGDLCATCTVTLAILPSGHTVAGQPIGFQR